MPPLSILDLAFCSGRQKGYKRKNEEGRIKKVGYRRCVTFNLIEQAIPAARERVRLRIFI